jgi:hypothetical protein
MITTDPGTKAYILECDHALKHLISLAAHTYRLDLPVPESPTQLRALNRWLDELYHETGTANRIHIYFRSMS